MRKLLFCLAVVSIFNLTQAQAGPHTIGNGGDPLEIRFKEIALNISQWIQSGNADAIQLPTNISLDQYKNAMQPVLSNYSIEFTDKSITVGGDEKTCVNLHKGSKNKVRCNIDRFGKVLKTNPDDLYRLIHHEFAGLSGLEKSDGADSDYAISDQLSAFLATETIKRLPIGPVIAHDFKCDVQITNNPNKIVLTPISSWETYMQEALISNLYISTYLWETRQGFDIKISSAPAPITSLKNVEAEMTELVFKAGPVFEMNMDGSKFGSAYFLYTSDSGTKIPMTITCTY